MRALLPGISLAPAARQKACSAKMLMEDADPLTRRFDSRFDLAWLFIAREILFRIRKRIERLLSASVPFFTNHLIAGSSGIIERKRYAARPANELARRSLRSSNSRASS